MIERGMAPPAGAGPASAVCLEFTRDIEELWWLGLVAQKRENLCILEGYRTGAAAQFSFSHSRGDAKKPGLLAGSGLLVFSPPFFKGERETGNVLLSHTQVDALSSGLQRFTSVFGMGTGGATAL